MPALPQITDAEWDVMRVVWDAPRPLTAGEVVDALGPRTRWRPRTIKTLLARLVKKGADRAAEDGDGPTGRRFLYRAAVRRDAVVRAESRSFLARVFDGAAAPALLHFLEESKLQLPPGEIERLRRLLQPREKEGDDDGRR